VVLDFPHVLEAKPVSQGHLLQGLKRQDASALAAELLTRYQATLPSPNRGKSFPEVYDIETVQPKQEWLDMYYDVKEDLTRLGLVLKHAPRPASA
jgi:hypothetical protein